MTSVGLARISPPLQSSNISIVFQHFASSRYELQGHEKIKDKMLFGAFGPYASSIQVTSWVCSYIPEMLFRLWFTIHSVATFPLALSAIEEGFRAPSEELLCSIACFIPGAVPESASSSTPHH